MTPFLITLNQHKRGVSGRDQPLAVLYTIATKESHTIVESHPTPTHTPGPYSRPFYLPSSCQCQVPTTPSHTQKAQVYQRRVTTYHSYPRDPTLSTAHKCRDTAHLELYLSPPPAPSPSPSPHLLSTALNHLQPTFIRALDHHRPWGPGQPSNRIKTKWKTIKRNRGCNT